MRKYICLAVVFESIQFYTFSQCWVTLKMATNIDGIGIIFGDVRQPKALQLSHPKARWGDFGRETKVLPKDYVRRKGCLPLPCDILFERDIPIKVNAQLRFILDVYI